MSAFVKLVIDLYCRISQDYDGTLRSVEDQERQGRSEVELAGHVVGKVYRDHALSAWDPKVVRPDFDELMARLESGESQGVWVRNLDRFTRKMEEAVRIKKAVERGAVLLAGYSSYDLDTAEGLDRFYNDAKNAEVESKRISERSSRGKAAKARFRGKSNASHRGFARPGNLPRVHAEGCPGSKGCCCPARDAELVPVPADQLDRERAAVRAAVADLLAGRGNLSALAREWNAAELWTVTGGRWDGALIRQMLVSPSIAGRIEHKGEIVGQLDGEPVIDPETHDALMVHFAGRKRGRTATRYVLSGVLRCGRCGGVLYGRPLTAKAPYAETGDPELDADRTARQYWCQVREKEAGGCGRLTIDQRFADWCVERMVVRHLGNPKQAERVGRVRVKLEAAQAELAAQLKQLQADRQSILDKVTEGLWSADEAAPMVAGANKRIAAAEAKLGHTFVELTEAEQTADAQADWDAADVLGKRALIKRAFPHGIAVLPAQSSGRAALTEARVVPLKAA